MLCIYQRGNRPWHCCSVLTRAENEVAKVIEINTSHVMVSIVNLVVDVIAIENP